MLHDRASSFCSDRVELVADVLEKWWRISHRIECCDCVFHNGEYVIARIIEGVAREN